MTAANDDPLHTAVQDVAKMGDPGFTTGDGWRVACDSYGTVRHSKMACVYTVLKGQDGDLIYNIAQRIKNWNDAKLIAAAPDLYEALEFALKLIHEFRDASSEGETLTDDFLGSAIVPALAALAKARGES